LLLVNAKDGYGIYFFKPEHGSYGWAGADYGLASRGFLRAIDYRTGKIVWERPYGSGSSSAGVLTTQTDLAITGDSKGNLMAVRTTDGKVLWHESIGRMGSAPVTVELDGKQYLLVSGGNTLYAYALGE
jgi:alcohol dehydrogenase (cytochrome c)